MKKSRKRLAQISTVTLLAAVLVPGITLSAQASTNFGPPVLIRDGITSNPFVELRENPYEYERTREFRPREPQYDYEFGLGHGSDAVEVGNQVYFVAASNDNYSDLYRAGSSSSSFELVPIIGDRPLAIRDIAALSTTHLAMKVFKSGYWHYAVLELATGQLEVFEDIYFAPAAMGISQIATNGNRAAFNAVNFATGEPELMLHVLGQPPRVLNPSVIVQDGQQPPTVVEFTGALSLALDNTHLYAVDGLNAIWRVKTDGTDATTRVTQTQSHQLVYSSDLDVVFARRIPLEGSPGGLYYLGDVSGDLVVVPVTDSGGVHISELALPPATSGDAILVYIEDGADSLLRHYRITGAAASGLTATLSATIEVVEQNTETLPPFLFNNGDNILAIELNNQFDELYPVLYDVTEPPATKSQLEINFAPASLRYLPVAIFASADRPFIIRERPAGLGLELLGLDPNDPWRENLISLGTLAPLATAGMTLVDPFDDSQLPIELLATETGFMGSYFPDFDWNFTLANTQLIYDFAGGQSDLVYGGPIYLSRIPQISASRGYYFDVFTGQVWRSTGQGLQRHTDAADIGTDYYPLPVELAAGLLYAAPDESVNPARPAFKLINHASGAIQTVAYNSSGPWHTNEANFARYELSPVVGSNDWAFFKSGTPNLGQQSSADPLDAYLVSASGYSVIEAQLENEEIIFFGEAFVYDAFTYVTAVVNTNPSSNSQPDFEDFDYRLYLVGPQLGSKALLQEVQLDEQVVREIMEWGSFAPQVKASRAVFGRLTYPDFPSQPTPGLYVFRSVPGDPDFVDTLSIVPGTENIEIISLENQMASKDGRVWFIGRPMPAEGDLRSYGASIYSATPEGIALEIEAPDGTPGYSGQLLFTNGQLIAALTTPRTGTELFSHTYLPEQNQNNSQNNNQDNSQNNPPPAQTQPSAPRPIGPGDFEIEPDTATQIIKISTSATLLEIKKAGEALFMRRVEGGYEAQLQEPPQTNELTLQLVGLGSAFEITMPINQITPRPLDHKVDSVIRRDGDNVRVVLYDLVGSGKVQLFHNGREVAWINAEDTSDPKLRTAPQGHYLVRNLRLEPGKNVIEVYQDNNRMRRVAHTQR